MENPEARQWRDAYRAGMQAGSDACPDDEALAALVIGELSANEHAALALHVTECRRCVEGYRTLRTLHAEAQRELSRRRRIRWPAVAAAAVLAVGLGVTLVWLGRTGGPVSTDGVVRGDGPLAGRVQPADGAMLEAPPPAFSWPAQPGAAEYRLSVYDETAELVWQGPTTQTAFARLPLQGGPKLAAGGAYFWTVEIDGRVARPMLGPFWFRIEK